MGIKDAAEPDREERTFIVWRIKDDPKRRPHRKENRKELPLLFLKAFGFSSCAGFMLNNPAG